MYAIRSYYDSERFVADMVKALQHNAINDFKRYYRNVDALLIDDIQFFAGKERSQEEFFHTFNALLEGQQQVILTCDRYPKEVQGLEERLKSRITSYNVCYTKLLRKFLIKFSHMVKTMSARA